MGLFSFGKKKKQEDADAAPGALPFDQVMMMKQQGSSDDQITQNLQSQGYNTSQIYDAINRVNISGQQPAQDPTQQPPEMPGYEMEGQMPPQQGMEPEPEPTERIEEIAEAIIDEKWKELSSDMNKVIEWKEKTESRLTKLEQQLLDIKASVDSLNSNLSNKISRYDQNITDVGTEIKAMEKVFQKVLPSLTENVNRLERISKKPPSRK